MNDADRLRVILGAAFEDGRYAATVRDPRLKRISSDQCLNELAEFLDIEFDEEGDIASICGTGFLWHTGERPEGV